MKSEISVTVDNVILCKLETTFKIVLIKRKNDPFKDQWALPGGFVEKNEDLPEAAKRELKEETGLDIKDNEQIGAFGKPGRDPRGRTISIAYLSRIFCEDSLKASDDATEAKWFDLQDLPDLAFDHAEIIEYAKGHL